MAEKKTLKEEPEKKTLKEEYSRLSEEIVEAEKAIRNAEDDEAEKEAKKAFEEKLKEFQKISDKYFSEKVTVRLFRDNGKYSDDVYVGWNGKSYLIQRGVDVEVPRGVAEIIKESEDQSNAASMIMKELQDDFESESRRRGISN